MLSAASSRCGGEFEISDLAPGTYRISIDRETIPANYACPTPSVEIELALATAISPCRTCAAID